MNALDTTSNRRVLITGAGSGIGAATALALASTHDLILVGRRPSKLDEVVRLVEAQGGRALAVTWDVNDDAAELMRRVGTVTDLVLSAGLNSPRRTWADQQMDEVRDVINTNLISVTDLITAALPSLREAAGTVVAVSSLSAWTASPGAGVAYRASKMGLRALTEALNEQEAVHGVRAGIILPGDIDSEFLSHRPHPPGADPRRSMLDGRDVARAVHFMLTCPPHLRIDELVITPLGTVER